MSIQISTVSVIIAAYDRIEYLPRAINSISEQTYSNFEILIYGDRALAEAGYHELVTDSRFKFFFAKQANMFEIYNQSIVEAQGEYITFLNIEDYWHSRRLQKQVFCLDRYTKVGLVHSWGVVVDRHGYSTGKILKDKLSGWLKPEILQRNRIDYSSVMVRRSCFNAVGLFDSKLETIQDWDMWIRISRRYQLMKIAEPLVFRQRQSDKTKENWLLIETNLQRTIEKVYGNLAIELPRLKSRSYAYASLCLAEKVLQHQNPNLVIADNYRRQAFEHSPRIACSLSFLQITLAIIRVYCLKSNLYRQLLSMITAIQSFGLAIINKLKISAHMLLKWMLDEEESLIFWKNRQVERQGKD